MLHPELKQEVARRRTFAIISHPDAGKTTLTEKLLLYGELSIWQAPLKLEKAINMLFLTGWKSKNNVVFPLLLLFCNLIMTVTA